MVTSIHPSVEPNKNSMAKKVATVAVGAGLGAGTAYLLQTRAIKKEIAKQEKAANLKGLKKLITQGWEKLKGWGKSIKAYCTEGLEKVAKEGKVSKKGIAKAAGVGAIALPTLLYINSKLSSKKED